MLRAAAKNHKHVMVVSDPGDYQVVIARMTSLRDGEDSEHQIDELYRLPALGVFWTTMSYDAQVTQWLDSQRQPDGRPSSLRLQLERCEGLRYGENPHQSSEVFQHLPNIDSGLMDLQEDENPMSFNNYVDGNAALESGKELTRAGLGTYAVAFIKHTNACGCAVGDDPVDTYRRAYLGDPIAAAGGVLCMNFPVTKEIADTVMHSFANWGKAAGAAFFKLDVWIAPAFDDDALELITTPTPKRKWGASCRLLVVGAMDMPPDEAELDYKKITGGMLVQTRDLAGLNEDQWKVATKRAPSESEMTDLRFAWLVCKHTKSNAITICRDGMLLGNGAGQMSRVKSCDLAIQLAHENGHGDKLTGAVAAGDAFFPVPDGPGKLIDAGITAIIHPGGSNRDAETVELADQHDVAMIVTGTRHFKH